MKENVKAGTWDSRPKLHGCKRNNIVLFSFVDYTKLFLEMHIWGIQGNMNETRHHLFPISLVATYIINKSISLMEMDGYWVSWQVFAARMLKYVDFPLAGIKKHKGFMNLTSTSERIAMAYWNNHLFQFPFSIFFYPLFSHVPTHATQILSLLVTAEDDLS